MKQENDCLQYEKNVFTIFFIAGISQNVLFIFEYDEFKKQMKKHGENKDIQAGWFVVINNKLFEMYKNFSLQLIQSGLEHETVFYETLKFYYVYARTTGQVNKAKIYNDQGGFLWG